MLQWAVFESSFVPLAAGDDAGALDRIERRPGGLPAQRLHRLRAVLRRAPGLGAPARRPTGRRPGGRGGARSSSPQRHRHTWWSTTASVPLRRHAARLRRARPGRGRRSGRPRRVAGRARRRGLPAALPRTAGGGHRGRRRAAAGRRPAPRHPGARRAARGCSAPTPTSGVARAWRRAGDPDRADADPDRLLAPRPGRPAGPAARGRPAPEPAARFLQCRDAMRRADRSTTSKEHGDGDRQATS